MSEGLGPVTRAGPCARRPPAAAEMHCSRVLFVPPWEQCGPDSGYPFTLRSRMRRQVESISAEPQLCFRNKMKK